jgi:hypothetical protein
LYFALISYLPFALGSNPIAFRLETYVNPIDLPDLYSVNAFRAFVVVLNGLFLTLDGLTGKGRGEILGVVNFFILINSFFLFINGNFCR